MSESITPKKFEQWLLQPENEKLLKTIADRLYQKMTFQNISLPGLNLQLSDAREIYQELLAFILQKPGIKKILLQGARGLAGYISTGFLNHVIERVRSKEESKDIYDNAWRYFYRRVSVVLRESSELKKYKSRSRGLCFGMSDTKPNTIILAEDLMAIAFPDDIPMNYKSMTKKKTILKLAVYFWKESAAATFEPHIRISIRDFFSWINKYVQLSASIASFPLTGNSEEKKYQFNPLINKADDPGPDSEKLSYIRKWAVNFFNILQGEEKKIFYYYECQGLKSIEISALMDRKANLSYQRDKLRARLKTFLRPLEWLSPEPVWKNERPDLDAFRFFTNKLCEKLEQTIMVNGG